MSEDRYILLERRRRCAGCALRRMVVGLTCPACGRHFHVSTFGRRREARCPGCSQERKVGLLVARAGRKR